LAILNQLETMAMARAVTVEFVIDKNTPPEDRVWMCEGDRLPGSPSYRQLHRACTIGTRVGRLRSGRRVKCPSRIGPHKRWTTVAAYAWYEAQLNGDA
jgi:hypothetical protein